MSKTQVIVIVFSDGSTLYDIYRKDVENVFVGVELNKHQYLDYNCINNNMHEHCEVSINIDDEIYFCSCECHIKSND